MTERHARAAEARGVSVRVSDDGMALLQVPLPATLAPGIGYRGRQQARAIRDAAIAERARRVAETAATETSTSAAAEMPGEATVADTVVAGEAGPETEPAEP